MMTYKQFIDPKAFTLFEKFGIRVTTLSETKSHLNIGLRIGAMNIVSVLFGLYSMKHVNIPLFLTFRRCCILATLIINYAISREVPGKVLSYCTAAMLLGSIIAGYESLDSNVFGYLLIWCNNFCTAFQNVVSSKYNKDKLITAFEINFYFAAIGLPLTLAICSYTSEI